MTRLSEQAGVGQFDPVSAQPEGPAGGVDATGWTERTDCMSAMAGSVSTLALSTGATGDWAKASPAPVSSAVKELRNPRLMDNSCSETMPCEQLVLDPQKSALMANRASAANRVSLPC